MQKVTKKVEKICFKSGISSYLLRLIDVCPGKLKQPRGITIRALPCAGRDPPWAISMFK